MRAGSGWPSARDWIACEECHLWMSVRFPVHDPEWMLTIPPLPQMPSACTPITDNMVHNAEPAIPVSPSLQFGSHCHQHARRTQDWIACESCHHTERAGCGCFAGRSSSGTIHGARRCVSTPRHPAVATVVIMRIGHKGIVQGDGCHVQAANLPSEQAAVNMLATPSAGSLQAYSLHRCSKCHRLSRWLQEA